MAEKVLNVCTDVYVSYWSLHVLKKENKSLKTFLHEKINGQKENFCSLENGIVQEVIRLKKITGNIVSRDDRHLIFKVEVCFKSIVPSLGAFYCSRIRHVFPVGIFLECGDPKIQVYIPKEHLQSLGLFYDKVVNTFSGINDKDYLTFCVKNVIFMDGGLQCIAEL